MEGQGGLALLLALRQVRIPLHRLRCRLFHTRVEPASNIYVDIAPSIDVKIASLLQHKSQVGSPQEVAAHVKKTASALGNVVGLTYAEWFTRVVEMS